MRPRIVVPLALLPLVVLAALAIAVLARPAEARGPGAILQLVQAYTGTARFLDVDRATAAGYGEFKDAAGIACIDLPGSGGMGTHFVSAGVGDTDIDPATPEALVYETKRNGNLRLVAVEYIVFQEQWDALHNARPTLFGQSFNLVEAGNRYGIPAFYELHAWIWKWNPSGLFQDWNPRVSCDTAN